jgi:hypothetical protein
LDELIISLTVVASDLDSFYARTRKLFRISCELNQVRKTLTELAPESRLLDIDAIRIECEEAGIDLDSVFSKEELVTVEKFVDKRIDALAEELRELTASWVGGSADRELLNSVYDDLHFEITTLAAETLQEKYLLELELEFLRLKSEL